MYLISIYFDEKTNKNLQRLINRVAEKTGNAFMLDNQVPPHITIAAMETRDEKKAIVAVEAFAILQNQFVSFEGTVVSIGIAKPNPHRDIALWKLPD